MYLKLSIRGVKRSYKEYLIYISTLIICTILIQVANTVSSLGNEVGVKDIVLPFTVSVILASLLCYINNHITRSRTKEFGIYTLLGMSKKSIANLFFLESLCIGIVSFIMGAILGGMISFVVFDVTFKIVMTTIFQSMIYFFLAELICLIYSHKLIRKLNILNLIKNKRHNENIKSSYKIWIIIFLFSLVSFFTILLLILNGFIFLTNMISVPFILMFYSFYKCLFLYLNKLRKQNNVKLYTGNKLYYITKLLSESNTNVMLNFVLALSISFSMGAFVLAFTLLYSDLLPLNDDVQTYLIYAQICISIIFLIIYFCVMSVRQITSSSTETFYLLRCLGKSIKNINKISLCETALSFTLPVLIIVPIILLFCLTMPNIIIISVLIYSVMFALLYAIYFVLTYKMKAKIQ